ncbi:MAG TPA: glycosyltransferase family 4 protein [Methylophilaceae bacterium]|nr:glycosyltransferase family 4 protein [Methylophilaceae bacterium]
MKFAFLIFKYFPFGGMQRDMLRIANELVKQGHTVDIFTISWQGELPECAINVHVMPVRGLLNFKRYQRFIDQAHARIEAAAQSGNKVDLIVGFNRMRGLDAYFGADPCYIERAHVQRGPLYRLTSRYRWFAECERLIFSADSRCEILLLSETQKLDFQRWYRTPAERFHFIPPYLSATRLALQDKAAMRAHLRNAFGFAAGDFVFLLVGSGFYMKGLDRALKALAALSPDLRAGVRLVAVGQDNPKPFLRMAQKLGVAEHLYISKGRADIPQLMQGADIYVHPGYHENTGLVILEALASGLPVLVTASCGYASHVESAQAGFVAPMPFDQRNFDKLFHTMLVSEQRSTWSRNGRDYAQKIMEANDGSAEANILIRLATHKNRQNNL